MIAVVLQISWDSLRRDRAALALTFLLPLVFFTVFASVFGDMDRGQERQFTLGLELQSDGVFSEELLATLEQNPALQIRQLSGVSRDMARQAIASGQFDAVVVVPGDFDLNIEDGIGTGVEVLTDQSNPITAPAVSGHLAQAVISTAGALSDDPAEEPVRMDVIDVVGGPDKRPSTAFFAAGLGVLFLMLSLTNRAGMMLEERESGTLQRMLSTQLGLNQLLAGRALFLLLLGLVQICVMFAWAALAFGLNLLDHLGAFAALAVLSALSASAFALAVVTLCRSREQLTAAATILVLLLAAIGGNLFPRFLMPEWMQALGWWTFNAWALDGFQQVFWYDTPLAELWRHGLILLLSALGLFGLARWWAGKWVQQ